jgi:hypothetical protein
MATQGSYSKYLRAGASAALALTMALGLGLTSASAQGRGKKLGHYKNGKIAERGPVYGSYGSGQARSMGTTNGYRQGFEQGERDRRDRRRFDYQNGGSYRSGNWGYNNQYGTQGEYQDAFRQAYARGYSDGFYGRAQNRDPYGYNNGGRSYDPYGRGNNDRYSTRNRRSSGGYYPNGGYYGGTNDPRYYSDREGDLDRDEVAKRAAQQGYYDGYQLGQYDRAQGTRRPNPQGHGAFQNALNGFDPEWGSALTYQRYYRQYFVQGHQAGFGQRSFDRRYQRRWW